ncbi:MAG TPA: GAP family protein [Pseudonocardia sp.]
MSLEALVLGLSTVIRPTSAAAVYAMLSAHRPRRLLVAYLATGLVFSLAIGVVIVLAFQGRTTAAATTVGRAVLDIVLGAAALGYGAGAWSGRLRRRPSRVDESWLQRRLHHLTPPVAALTGVVTHLPGIVYLAALNAIVGSATGPTNSVLQVVVYNALWFSLPIVALVLSVYRPTVSRDLLERGSDYARRHKQLIVVAACLLLGTYLVVKGIVDLHTAAG